MASSRGREFAAPRLPGELRANARPPTPPALQRHTAESRRCRLIHRRDAPAPSAISQSSSELRCFRALPEKAQARARRLPCFAFGTWQATPELTPPPPRDAHVQGLRGEQLTRELTGRHVRRSSLFPNHVPARSTSQQISDTNAEFEDFALRLRAIHSPASCSAWLPRAPGVAGGACPNLQRVSLVLFELEREAERILRQTVFATDLRNDYLARILLVITGYEPTNAHPGRFSGRRCRQQARKQRCQQSNRNLPHAL